MHQTEAVLGNASHQPIDLLDGGEAGRDNHRFAGRDHPCEQSGIGQISRGNLERRHQRDQKIHRLFVERGREKHHPNFRRQLGKLEKGLPGQGEASKSFALRRMRLCDIAEDLSRGVNQFVRIVHLKLDDIGAALRRRQQRAARKIGVPAVVAAHFRDDQRPAAEFNVSDLHVSPRG